MCTTHTCQSTNLNLCCLLGVGQMLCHIPTFTDDSRTEFGVIFGALLMQQVVCTQHLLCFVAGRTTPLWYQQNRVLFP